MAEAKSTPECSVNAIRERLVEITVEQIAADKVIQQKEKLKQRNMDAIKEYETRLTSEAKENKLLLQASQKLTSEIEREADKIPVIELKNKLADSEVQNLIEEYKSLRRAVDATRAARKTDDARILEVCPRIEALEGDAKRLVLQNEEEQKQIEGERRALEKQRAATTADQQALARQLKVNANLRAEIKQLDESTRRDQAIKHDLDREVAKLDADIAESERHLKHLKERDGQDKAERQRIREIEDKMKTYKFEHAELQRVLGEEEQKIERARQSVEVEQAKLEEQRRAVHVLQQNVDAGDSGGDGCDVASLSGCHQLLQSTKAQDDDEVRRLEAMVSERRAEVQKMQAETTASNEELKKLQEEHAELKRKDSELQAQVVQEQELAAETEASMNRSYGEFTLLCEQLRQEQSQRKVWELQLTEIAPFIATRLRTILEEAEQDERKLVRDMERTIDTCCNDDQPGSLHQPPTLPSPTPSRRITRSTSRELQSHSAESSTEIVAATSTCNTAETETELLTSTTRSTSLTLNADIENLLHDASKLQREMHDAEFKELVRVAKLEHAAAEQAITDSVRVKSQELDDSSFGPLKAEIDANEKELNACNEECRALEAEIKEMTRVAQERAAAKKQERKQQKQQQREAKRLASERRRQRRQLQKQERENQRKQLQMQKQKQQKAKQKQKHTSMPPPSPKPKRKAPQASQLASRQLSKLQSKQKRRSAHSTSRALPLESIAEIESESESEAPESLRRVPDTAHALGSSSSTSSRIALTRKQFKSRANKRKHGVRLVQLKHKPKPAGKAKAKTNKVRHHIDVFNHDAFNFD